MKLKRNIVNFVLEGFTLAALALLAGTGLLLEFRLPPGSGQRLEMLGLTRHEWGTIHFYVSLAFLVLLVVHLALHWRWIWAMAKGKAQKMRTARTAGFVAVTALFLLLVVAPWMLPVHETGDSGGQIEIHESHGDGQGDRLRLRGGRD